MLVGFGYPFSEIMQMPVSDALEWVKVAAQRTNNKNGA